MGRNRTPTSILDAKGAFNQNPQRRRPDEPEPTGELGNPPKFMTKDEKKIWRELSRRIAPGVAYADNRDPFVLLVRLTDKLYKDTASDTQQKTLINLWSKFGLTPADRSKVAVEKGSKSALSTFLSKKIA